MHSLAGVSYDMKPRPVKNMCGAPFLVFVVLCVYVSRVVHRQSIVYAVSGAQVVGARDLPSRIFSILFSSIGNVPFSWRGVQSPYLARGVAAMCIEESVGIVDDAVGGWLLSLETQAAGHHSSMWRRVVDRVLTDFSHHFPGGMDEGGTGSDPRQASHHQEAR